MNKMLKIAKQEFKMMTANKAFVITTILGPVFLFAITVLPSILGANAFNLQEDTVVGVHGIEESQTEELMNLFHDTHLKLSFFYGDLDRAIAAVEENEIAGVLSLPADYKNNLRYRYYSQTGTDAMIYGFLENRLGAYISSTKLMEAGLDPAVIAELSQKPQVQVSRIGSSDDTEDRDIFSTVMLTVISFMMMIYMTTLLYGQMIGRSVIKEKQNKTVELLLSSARSIDIMFGKLFGIGAAGLLQYFIWISMAYVLVSILGPRFNISAPEFLSASNIAYLISFFIAAYLLYSAAYAALGAAAEDEQHLGQLGFPLILFLIVPMVMISPMIMQPNAAYVRFFSLFPFTSPMVMLVRILISSPSLFELILCFGILALTIAIITFFASKIFRIGILMTGKRFSLGEIVKWISYK